ncbi:MAG: exodeoxyribonuclease VII small subunit [Clostridiales bacterium]|nr:exodeoxyribonuclease VII small subunit [Clostridiales bacterium]
MDAKRKTFEESMLRLEEIVTRLEKGDATLEESMALFEEGTKLAAACAKQLDTAEQKVLKLTGTADTVPVEQPMKGDLS